MVRVATRRTATRGRALVLVLAVVVLGSTAVSAQAAGSDTSVLVVYPTGRYPIDHQNVQAAVDAGGTVLLKAIDMRGVPAAFNFGPAVDGVGGQVDLTTDVAVVGESTGSHMTTIRGGVIPFFGTVAVRTRIEGISFEGPLLAAIIITRSTGSDIVGNRISGVVGSELLLALGVPPLTEGRGIKFLGNGDPDGDITGSVRVVGNVIEDMHADLSDAIVFDAAAADVEISQNRIETTQSSGIFVINSAGSVEITDNFVAPGAGDPEGLSFGNGVTVAGLRGARLEITGNEIVCENPAADGIYLVGNDSLGAVEDAVVSSNRITMAGSTFAAIALEDDVSRTSITGNTIVGAANHAFELRQVEDGSTAELNDLRDNDITAFQAAAGEAFLDRHTRATRVVGPGGVVTDMGDGNLLEGFAPFPLGPAQPQSASRVIVPAPGVGTRIEPLTAAAAEFDIGGTDQGWDNARIDVLATPTAAADLDLFLERHQPDGTWLTVTMSAGSDLDREHLVARRQPPGRYRILVHNWSGGPQVADVVVTFFNQDDEAA